MKKPLSQWCDETKITIEQRNPGQDRVAVWTCPLCQYALSGIKVGTSEMGAIALARMTMEEHMTSKHPQHVVTEN
ncbi:hypothetical protein [Brevifollis gellanilyticus]|nr:hypothetical protein [Brevifollis gellanilyticus]